ncbi:MAG: DUF1178 family protein [Parvularculaceae bacterium]|nr:DUF1178 family protein [Parvularculaceae bacterium]
MIKYSLQCQSGCAFEGWFQSMADYDRQAESGRLECPVCGGGSVSKAIMAPAVATSEKRSDVADMRSVMLEAAKRARDYVEKNFDYVGGRFPEEARAIHYGEKEERRIYGEATGAEVKSLIEEGVGVAPVPGPDLKERLAPPTPRRSKASLN